LTVYFCFLFYWWWRWIFWFVVICWRWNIIHFLVIVNRFITPNIFTLLITIWNFRNSHIRWIWVFFSDSMLAIRSIWCLNYWTFCTIKCSLFESTVNDTIFIIFVIIIYFRWTSRRICIVFFIYLIGITLIWIVYHLTVNFIITGITRSIPLVLSNSFLSWISLFTNWWILIFWNWWWYCIYVYNSFVAIIFVIYFLFIPWWKIVGVVSHFISTPIFCIYINIINLIILLLFIGTWSVKW